MPDPTDRERLLALALCLKGIDDAYEELADFKATIKARVETLLKESRAIRYEILSGQGSLPLELTAPRIEDVLEKVVEEVNAGALNKSGVTCTAEMRNVDECSTEETERTRKTRKKLQGQDAILPDKRNHPPQPGAPA